MIELLTWATPNGARPAIMLEEVGRKTRLREALGTTPGIDGWLKEINARDAVQRGLARVQNRAATKCTTLDLARWCPAVTGGMRVALIRSCSSFQHHRTNTKARSKISCPCKQNWML